MGFLDMFDNPDVMGSLLGITPAQAKPAPPPPPPPPPQMMAPPPQPPSPWEGGVPSSGNVAALPPQLGPGPQPQPQQNGADAPPTPPIDPRTLPPMQPGQFADRYNPVDAARDIGTFSAPGDTDRFKTADASGGVPAPRGRGVNIPSNVAPPGGAPLPPPEAMAGAPATSAMSGGLRSVLGLTPDAWRSAAAGVGRGLSAVGRQPPGTFAGASFAAGAGGGLEGQAAAQNQQEQQKRQAQNDLFNQKSVAFKDWMEAEKLGDSKMLTAARTKYYEALAGMKASGAGGKGSSAWQNTPYGKASQLETMLDKWAANERLQLAAKWKAVGSTPEEVQADLAGLEKRRTAERERRAKALGIDPGEYKKGTSREDAFDFDKATPEQRLQIPDSAWYRYKDPSDPKADKDGYVYKQRDWLAKPPHEGWQPPQPQAQPPQPQQRPPSPYEVEAHDQAVSGA